MSTLRRFWFSPIEYRPDPSRPEEGKITLGVVVEAEFRNMWVVAAKTRAILTEDELARLDGLGKELLKDPAGFIGREVESVLPRAKKPGDVLKLLAQAERWSFHVTSPSKKGLAGAGKSPRVVMLNKLEALYANHVRGIAAGTARRSAPPSALPWAAPPKEWDVSLAAHA